MGKRVDACKSFSPIQHSRTEYLLRDRTGGRVEVVWWISYLATRRAISLKTFVHYSESSFVNRWQGELGHRLKLGNGPCRCGRWIGCVGKCAGSWGFVDGAWDEVEISGFVNLSA